MIDFGDAVAVGDNKIVVGCKNNRSNRGAVYVYDLDGTNEIKITASNEDVNFNFGSWVAIGSNKIAVGAPGVRGNQGAVYLYDLDGNNEKIIEASDQAVGRYFGTRVAINGNQVAVGADPAVYGAVYIYTLEGTKEFKITHDTISERFGEAVEFVGDDLWVGARYTSDPEFYTGKVHKYTRNVVQAATEAFSAQTPEDTILFNASGEAIKKATIREVFSGILTFSGAATNEQFTGDPPEETILFVANGDAHTTRARDKVGTGLASLSGIASCREIANYGYYGDDRDPGTSGLITISGSTLADPDSGVTYIPHYGIERNIGVGTTGIQIEPRTRFGFNTGFDADGNERGARYYSNVYPRNDVAELDGGSGAGGFRLNDDKELTFTRALLPYKASGLGVFSGTGNEAFCIVGYEGDAGTTFFSGAAETRQIDVFGFYGDDARSRNNWSVYHLYSDSGYCIQKKFRTSSGRFSVCNWRKLGYSTYIWISGRRSSIYTFWSCGSIRCGRSTECCSLRDSWSWYREFCCTTNRRYGTIYVSRSTRIGKNNQVLPWSSCIPSSNWWGSRIY